MHQLSDVKSIVLFTVVLTLIVCTEAQNQRRKLSRSPFQPPNNKDDKLPDPQERPRYDVQGGNPLVQSPFTPPQDFVVKELTTRRTVTSPPSKSIPVVNNLIPQNHVPSVGSPFTPPTQTEWRKDDQALSDRRQQWKPKSKPSSWLNALEQRQGHNANSIPPISNIEISNDNSNNNKRRRRFRPKPRASVYQENQHSLISNKEKDIHDVGPGVTPWTRYTEKPRVHEDSTGGRSRRARCGRLRYSPRNQICCQGRVKRRIGVSPACCGTEAYDTVYNKCCNGVVSIRAHGEPDC